MTRIIISSWMILFIIVGIIAGIGIYTSYMIISTHEERFDGYYQDNSDYAKECQGIHGYLAFTGKDCGYEMHLKIKELEERIEKLENER